jgi:malonate-semialdehyde dehydrogenase (acetylating) / methylmalonate-semialdehyde dehydrogenase
VPKTTQAEMNEAVANAKETFRTWSKTTILQRQQVMFRYQDLVRKNMVSGRMFVLLEKMLIF